MWSGVMSERQMSKRLKLVKRVRECYTRDDVSCGFECCNGSYGTSRRVAVFVIPTAEVLTGYKALFRSEYVAAIVCQSVLESLPKSEERHVRDIIRDRGHVVFYDKFHRSTHGKGLDSVVGFYRDHLPQHKFIVLGLENVRSYGEYVEEDIGDLLETVSEDETTGYEEYRNNLDVMWRRGDLYRGSLQVSTYNCYSGFVLDSNVKILIVGRTNMNRAVHGDEVYVEVVERTGEDMIFLENDRIPDAVEDTVSDGERVFGRVVGIHRRKWRTVIGTISRSSVCGDGMQSVLVLPIDRRMPAIRMRTKDVSELSDRRLCIEMDGWEQRSNYPIGHCYKRLERIGGKEGEMEAILMANGIDYYDVKWSDVFGRSSIRESDFSLEKAYKEVSDGDREDLRSLNIVSIDPPGCTDIDDALHFRQLPNGNMEVGVHIADVTLQVDMGSILDGIAADRGTTVYLPDRRIDMLPPILSTSLCSLVENEDRAAFSVIWEMCKDARVIKTYFCRSLIRSRRSLSYEEADGIIRGTVEADGETGNSLRNLCEISKVLRKRRFDNGSLDLSTRELVFTKDGFEVKECLQTNFLVEEFMLLANTTAASFIYHHCPDTSLLRRHPPPSTLIQGLDIDTSSPQALNESLGRLEGTRREIVKRSLIKSMNQAVYFISGATTDFSHYGLAIPIYTHFTSPIRRYADIVVHRILNHILHTSSTSEETSMESLGMVSFRTRRGLACSGSQGEVFIDEDGCRRINLRHRCAQRAAWECNRLATYLVLRDIEPAADGHVVEVKSNGVVVYIPEYNIEEAVLCGERLEMFQPLRIRIVRDDENFFMRRRFSLEIAR